MRSSTAKYNNGSIIFMPDYAYRNFKQNKLGLDRLDSVLYSNDDFYDVCSELSKNTDSVSSSDVKDVYALNTLMYKHLFNVNIWSVPYYSTTLGTLLDICENHIYGKGLTTYEKDDTVSNELIKLFNNDKINTTDILLNGNSKNDLCSIEYTDNTMLIIIHDGFTNFILDNNKEVKNNLSKGLLDYYVTKLGIESFNKSYLLKLGLAIAKA